MNMKAFRIRSYGKSELAMMYFPNLTQETAMSKFREWLRINPRLQHLISRSSHTYTPKQVRLIVGEVGEPFDTEPITE